MSAYYIEGLWGVESIPYRNKDFRHFVASLKTLDGDNITFQLYINENDVIEDLVDGAPDQMTTIKLNPGATILRRLITPFELQDISEGADDPAQVFADYLMLSVAPRAIPAS